MKSINTYNPLNYKFVIRLIVLFSLIFIQIDVLEGQIQGHNLVELQNGGFPQDAEAKTTLYERLVLKHSSEKFRISSTLETFLTPREKSEYLKLSQLLLQFNFSSLNIKLGNFYDTIGRGLILRAFEIQGATLEDLSFRTRHYFHKDILGLNVELRKNNYKAKLLYGKPLNYVFPPTFAIEDRRPDAIGAAILNFNSRNKTFGLATMYHHNENTNAWYAMVNSSGAISNNYSYYTEFAKDISGYDLNDFSDSSPFAYYGSLNFSYNSFGISAEYKYYNNFLIGFGVNEPPSLVKEHTYRVLNRSTHVLEPTNEKGYQVELFYTFPDFSILTFNNTIAVNDFGRRYRFSEYFLEYVFPILNKLEAKVFIDFAIDPLKSETQRFSTGGYVDWKIAKNHSLNTNYEYQSFVRDNNAFQNHVLILGYSYNSKLFLNVETEFSNDSFVTNQGSKNWLGTSIRYRPKKGAITIQLFIGERRGGPACSSGVCYEVLDFKGAELRLTSRF